MDATKMRDLVIKKKLVQRRQIGTNRQREVNEQKLEFGIERPMRD